MLVSTEMLAAHIGDPSWIIFDGRHDLADFEKGARLYRAQHVPGAHFAPVETALSGAKTGTNGRHPLPDPEAFAKFLARHGVSEKTHVVAYDDVGGQYASRLWWMARWIGLEQVALLDGGFPKWMSENRPVSAEVPRPHPATLRVHLQPEMACSIEELQRRLASGDAVVLDARAAERFRGETEPIDRVAGRIPGAVNRFFKLNLQSDLTFRPASELKGEYEALLGSRRNVVHACGSGVTACVNLFAMEYAGLPGSQLYPGSWSEWSADPTRPIERG